MRFTQLAFVFAIPLVGAAPNTVTQHHASTEIVRLEHELARAVVNRDYNALRRIEADTYVYTDSDAKVSTREEFITSYQAGRSRISRLTYTDLTVETYGDAAVVRGLLTIEREDAGVAISRVSRYTRFYVRFQNGWQAVAGHSSSLKTTPAVTR